MGTGFAEAPLAVFTTLAPMGAAAFIVLLAAALKGAYAGDAARRIDRMTVLPVAVILAGFVGAFFHLASPLNAIYVLDGIGRSPLTNEVVVGCAVFALAVVYWALALAGKLSGAARTGFLAVLSVAAVAFAAFCGMAYLMDTIPGWNQPGTVVQMLGYALLGGAVLGCLVLAAAKAELPAGFGAIPTAVAAAGLALGALGFGMQIAACGGIYTVWGPIAEQVPAIWGLFAAFVVGGLAACALTAVGVRKPSAGQQAAARTAVLANPALMAVALAVVAVVVFFARIGFYGLS